MSDKINDGKHAFPCASANYWQSGMTLRDWFAGMALSGLTANAKFSTAKDRYPRHAYQIADAMIAEREKEAEQEADLMSSASHISALEAKCSDLEQQLASMTAERDSESRWAKQYCEEADDLKRLLAYESDKLDKLVINNAVFGGPQ